MKVHVRVVGVAVFLAGTCSISSAQVIKGLTTSPWFDASALRPADGPVLKDREKEKEPEKLPGPMKEADGEAPKTDAPRFMQSQALRLLAGLGDIRLGLHKLLMYLPRPGQVNRAASQLPDP